MATNENDENGGSTRVTRAKAAAGGVPSENAVVAATKKPLQTRKTTTTTTQAGRRRAALGDVSNVPKNDAVEGKDGKKAVAKATTVSKAAAAGGIQKLSRTNSSRAALGVKDNNKKSVAPAELKRPASGSGVLSGVQKKRQTVSGQSLKEETPEKEEKVEKEESLEVKKAAPVEEKVEAKVEDALSHHKDIKEAFHEAILDLDQEDRDDPLMVAEYVVDIYEYMKELEETTMPNPDYMDHQEDLEWKMRGILVDWLIEVHTRFHLLPETLFLAINIIDRFLSAKVVQLDKLQLVGVTAMFIASKYEEVLSPHVANFRHVADEAFTEAEILGAERYVLAALNYDLSYPNPMNFLRRISKADNYDIQTRTLGKYLTEISLLDHRFLGYRQSHVAAAAMYLARLILERGPWVCLS